MNYATIISSLTFFAALSSFSMEARFYYCSGADLEFTFLHALTDNEHYLEVEFAGAKIKTTPPLVSDVNDILHIVTSTKNSRQFSTLELKLEKLEPPKLLDDFGVIQFPGQFKTWVTLGSIRGKELREVECEIFGLTENFLDEIGACIL